MISVTLHCLRNNTVALMLCLRNWQVLYEGESRENLKLHVASGAAIFTPLLRRRVAFLHRTATCWPLFKPWVSLLSTYRQSSCVSNCYRTSKVFIWLSLVQCSVEYRTSVGLSAEHRQTERETEKCVFNDTVGYWDHIASVIHERAWKNGGMILTGHKELCPCPVITWSVLWSNPGHGCLCYQYA